MASFSGTRSALNLPAEILGPLFRGGGLGLGRGQSAPAGGGLPSGHSGPAPPGGRASRAARTSASRRA